MDEKYQSGSYSNSWIDEPAMQCRRNKTEHGRVAALRSAHCSVGVRSVTLSMISVDIGYCFWARVQPMPFFAYSSHGFGPSDLILDFFFFFFFFTMQNKLHLRFILKNNELCYYIQFLYIFKLKIKTIYVFFFEKFHSFY